MVSECPCATFDQTKGIGLGNEDEWFDQLLKLATFGEERWWLSACRCDRCAQSWLVACDSRVYDHYHLQKIEPPILDAIIRDQRWPDHFATYADLLEAGKMAGIEIAYFDPLESLELLYSIVDLASEQPGIQVSRLSELLPISQEQASRLARRAVSDENVAISFGTY